MAQKSPLRPPKPPRYAVSEQTTELDAIVAVDAGQIIIGCNPAAEALLQRTASELLGAPLTAFPLPIGVSTSQVDLNGEPITVLVIPKAHSDKGHLDAESEERYRRIIETAYEGVWQLDANLRTVFVNARMAEIFGYSPAEMLGVSAFDHFHPSALDFVRERAKRRRLGEPEQYTVQMQRKDGSIVWALINSQPLTDASGAFNGSLAMVTDVTARKQAEAQLRASQERFRHLTDGLPQLIWTCDEAGHCDFLSAQWTHYTGIPIEQLLDTGWSETVHPDDRTALHEQWEQSVATGADFHSEFRIRRDNGDYRWFASRGSCHCDEAQRKVRWYGANTDIEDERRARDVQMRNQKMEALGTLAGGIAHDFNNVLTAITGNTILALEDIAEGHPARTSLLEIERASRRATDFVRRILAFSRQEETKREVVSLQLIIDEAVKLLRPSVPAHIELRADYDPATPHTIADGTQVHQILMNLVTNAAYAIGDGSGLIEIALEPAKIDEESASPDLKTGSYARLTITDNGCGMERGTMQRIFDPFFTTKPMGDGTGLGLSVVAGIMKAHGGAVSVYSEKDKGSVFRLYFPATADRAAVRKEERRALPAARGQRVLYVDDDEFLLSLVGRKLTRLGYTVTCDQDPHTALLNFRRDPEQFDVVVTDLSMPRIRGFELAQFMLAIRPDLPVIVTSGYIQPEDQIVARNIGIRELVLKPNTSDDLGVLLDRLFHEQ